MSVPDDEAFLKRTGGLGRAGQASDPFRSLVFGAWARPSVPVEVMGGLSVAAGGGWRDVQLSTREPVNVAGARVYVPAADEVVRLLETFGRARDLERVQKLRHR